jgi:hypothetical protein
MYFFIALILWSAPAGRNNKTEVALPQMVVTARDLWGESSVLSNRQCELFWQGIDNSYSHQVFDLPTVS